VLSLLAELPVSDPPAGLVDRTMQRIDRHLSQHMGQQNSITQSNSTQVH
jgi:hypothetical protein